MALTQVVVLVQIRKNDVLELMGSVRLSQESEEVLFTASTMEKTEPKELDILETIDQGIESYQVEDAFYRIAFTDAGKREMAYLVLHIVPIESECLAKLRELAGARDIEPVSVSDEAPKMPSECEPVIDVKDQDIVLPVPDEAPKMPSECEPVVIPAPVKLGSVPVECSASQVITKSQPSFFGAFKWDRKDWYDCFISTILIANGLLIFLMFAMYQDLSNAIRGPDSLNVRFGNPVCMQLVDESVFHACYVALSLVVIGLLTKIVLVYRRGMWLC